MTTVREIRSSLSRWWIWLRPIRRFPVDPPCSRRRRHREPRKRLFPANLGWSLWWLASLGWWWLKNVLRGFSVTLMIYFIYFAFDCLDIRYLIMFNLVGFVLGYCFDKLMSISIWIWAMFQWISFPFQFEPWFRINTYLTK